MTQSFVVVLLLLLALCKAVTIQTEGVDVLPCLDQAEIDNLVNLKSLIYSGFTASRGAEVAEGVTNPVENADWHNALLVNYRIDNVEALADFLNLADGVTIAPTPILDSDDEGEYYLTLSIKQVFVSDQGQEPTTQLHWFVYVTTPDNPQAMLMIADSICDFETVTPLGWAEASPISLESNYESYILSVDGRVLLELDTTQLTPTALSHDFVLAFERVYWPNGVFSRLFTNGSLPRAQPLAYVKNSSNNEGGGKKRYSSSKKSKANKKGKRKSSDSKSSKKSNKGSDEPTATKGAPFLDFSTQQLLNFVSPDPEHIVYFPDTILLGEETWINADEVDPDLAAARATIFSNRATLESQEVKAGTRDPIATFIVETENVPSYYINFVIREDRVQDFQDAVVPSGFTLARIRWRNKMTEPQYIVTVNIYESSGLAPGFRAEWSIFVNANGIDSPPRFMVLEAISSTPSFDPVNTFTAPAITFEHKLEGRTVTSMYVDSNESSFSASIVLPEVSCSNNEASLETDDCDVMSNAYIIANDEIYWGNGVQDRALYSGNFRDIPVAVVSQLASVNLSNTRWAEYLNANQAEVILFSRIPTFFLSPMFNLEEIAVCSI